MKYNTHASSAVLLVTCDKNSQSNLGRGRIAGIMYGKMYIL